MKHPVRLACAGLILLAPARGLAIDRDECAVPYEEAQVLRKQRIFSAAMEQLDQCRAKCPAVLAADCAQWAAEVKALTPTVVFRIHDASGGAVRAFRVLRDGVVLAESPGDRGVALDPGAHVLRFVGPSFEPTEVAATLNAGEHLRVIDVTVPLSVPAGLSPRAPEKRSPAPAITLGTIGVVGLLAAGALDVVGFAERANLQDTCAPTCGSGRVDAIRVVWWAAGISAGLGAASLTASVLLWPRAKSGANGWWAPTVGPGSLGLTGAF